MQPRTGPIRHLRKILVPLVLLLMSTASDGAAAERSHCRMELAAITDSGLRVLVTQVDLQGRLLREAGLELEIGSEKKATPTARRPLLPTEKKLHFVLLVEGSAAYAPATDAVRGALRSFLGALPQDSAGEVWRFGNRVDAPQGFKPIVHLLGLVDRYSATDEGELQMLKAVRQGLAVLGAADPETRRVLVLLSDGFNPVMDRQLFREVGQELARRGVPLFPVAYSPRDVRGPLRNLGELSRHSAGTLRWARSVNELEPQFVALAAELLSAEVLTFDDRAVAKLRSGQASLRLKCGEGHSNTCVLTVPARRGIALWLGMAALGAAVATAGVWGWLRRRRKTRPIPAAQAGPGLVGRSGSLHGQKVRLGEVLRLGIGLSGNETLTLGSGPAEPLCEIRKGDSARYAIATLGKNSHVFINGRQLLGSLILQDGDRVQVGELAEFIFHDQLDI